MAHREEILGFLNNISPRTASNAEIVSYTRIKPHQQVFQITQALVNDGLISGQRAGREWHFSANKERIKKANEALPRRKPKTPKVNGGALSPSAFERLCQKVLSKNFGTELKSGSVEGVRKQFDLVSDDGQIIGDAKYYTAVRGHRLPPAKFATIAEYVWLLEKTSAEKKFLIFGNDRRVPEWWLERYGDLLNNVDFYFLSDDRLLEKLA